MFSSLQVWALELKEGSSYTAHRAVGTYGPGCFASVMCRGKIEPFYMLAWDAGGLEAIKRKQSLLRIEECKDCKACQR